MTLMETLYKEHDEIWAFTEQMTQKCIDLMEHNVFDADGFRADISYIRTYADATHHKKEEDLLFRAMLDELGQMAETLIRHGMLIEHDQARLYVMELETAVNAYETDRSPALKLEILSQAMDYVHLLRRHIGKENNAIYPFAEHTLSPDTMRELEAQFQSEWNHA